MHVMNIMIAGLKLSLEVKQIVSRIKLALFYLSGKFNNLTDVDIIWTHRRQKIIL